MTASAAMRSMPPVPTCEVGRVGGGDVGGVERGVGAAVLVVAGEAELRGGADAHRAADDEPAAGQRHEAAASMMCEGETSCVRVPAVPNAASERAGGREAGEADEVRRRTARALDGGDGQRGARRRRRAAAAPSTSYDAGGRAVEVGGGVAAPAP